MFKIDPDTCIICNEQLQSELQIITVKQKAINTIIKLSIEKNDGLSEYYGECLSGLSELQLHNNCLKKYSERPLETSEDSNQDGTPLEPFEHSNQDGFRFDKLCFICGEKAGPEQNRKIVGKGRDKQNLVCEVKQASTVKLTLLRYAAKNPSASIQKVVDRIKDVELEKGGRYHRKCYWNILKGPDPQRSRGRPISDRVSTSMKYAFDYIESSGDGYFFIRELDTVIADSCDYVPDRRTIKAKLMERYNDTISFSITPSNNTLITIKDPNDPEQEVPYWNSQEERMKIVKKAAKIIRYDVFKVEPELPVSLNGFIEILATLDRDENKKRKIAESIAVYVKNC